MTNSTKLLAVVCTTVGAALGYAAATGRLNAERLTAAQPKVEDKAAPTKAEPYKIDRTSLPIAEPKLPFSDVLDARDAKAPPRFQVKAPDGAPNVLIILIDDM